MKQFFLVLALVSFSFLQAQQDSSKYLAIGLSPQFMFYDAVDISGAAGAGGSVVVTYENSKNLFAQGRVGFNYLFSDPQDLRAINVSGVLGRVDGRFAYGIELGSLQFLSDAQRSAITAGIVGQFRAPVSSRISVAAEMGFGVMFKRNTTYGQRASLIFLYTL